MAKQEFDQKKLQATIDAWSKGQKKVEEAQAALEAARAEVAPYAKTVYEAVGTKAFPVKALGGRKYRVLHSKERTNEKTGHIRAESYCIIPVPEFETDLQF